MTTPSPEIEIPQGRVLVTGGSGHLGANLVRRLLDEGQEVRCLVQAGADNRGLDGLDIERVWRGAISATTTR